MRDCKYKLPCGWCDKQNKKCSKEPTQTEDKKRSKYCLAAEAFLSYKNKKCEHNWHTIGSLCGTKFKYTMFKCSKCGIEQVIRNMIREDGRQCVYVDSYDY